MRQIKFRAWDGERFTYWGLGIMVGAFVGPASTPKGNPMSMDHQQFTGLLDKNGKEIYEGDIVYLEDCSPDDPAYGFYSSGYEVRWNLGHWEMHSEQTVKTEFLEEYNEVSRVIGNIYENPELLRVKNENR